MSVLQILLPQQSSDCVQRGPLAASAKQHGAIIPLTMRGSEGFAVILAHGAA